MSSEQKAIAPTARVLPGDDVVVTALDGGEAVLLHLGSRKYFTLNATGLAIWHGLDEGLTVAEVSERLSKDYGISRERALASVTRLLSELHDTALVQLVGDET